VIAIYIYVPLCFYHCVNDLTNKDRLFIKTVTILFKVVFKPSML